MAYFGEGKSILNCKFLKGEQTGHWPVLTLPRTIISFLPLQNLKKKKRHVYMHVYIH